MRNPVQGERDSGMIPNTFWLSFGISISFAGILTVFSLAGFPVSTNGRVGVSAEGPSSAACGGAGWGIRTQRCEPSSIPALSDSRPHKQASASVAAAPKEQGATNGDSKDEGQMGRERTTCTLLDV